MLRKQHVYEKCRTTRTLLLLTPCIRHAERHSTKLRSSLSSSRTTTSSAARADACVKSQAAPLSLEQHRWWLAARYRPSCLATAQGLVCSHSIDLVTQPPACNLRCCCACVDVSNRSAHPHCTTHACSSRTVSADTCNHCDDSALPLYQACKRHIGNSDVRSWCTRHLYTSACARHMLCCFTSMRAGIFVAQARVLLGCTAKARNKVRLQASPTSHETCFFILR